MRISDWSSDVCSSDLQWTYSGDLSVAWEADLFGRVTRTIEAARADTQAIEAARDMVRVTVAAETARSYTNACSFAQRSEEHTSELQSLMRISYAVFCLKKKTQYTQNEPHKYLL